MNTNISIIVFLLVEILIATLIILTVGELPENIASHFNSTGTPNGFMSHDAYLGFILVMAIGIPALVVGSLPLLLRLSPGNINIPNREFWLAPERQQGTAQFLSAHIPWLGSLISLLVGYVHWLLIQANSVQPPRLPNSLLLPGVGLFLAGVAAWIVLLYVRFGRLPKP